MYKFGRSSKARLDTCHPKIVEILEETIQIVDFTVLCGHRGEDEQNAAYHEGRSKLKFPQSKHNQSPSIACDVAPYPIDWNNIERFAQLGGIIKGIAHSKGIKVRCGFDWDCDGDITDHSFMDWPHFELILD